MFVIIQAHHGHQEALDDLPGLPAVIGLRVGALQTVQGCLNCLEWTKRTQTLLALGIHHKVSNQGTGIITNIKTYKICTVWSAQVKICTEGLRA